jgi:chromosome segregation protein
MRLKKLILHGFKSFADRTELAFDSPITGIVGPNGCGKSNVVDAVKWVLGEQSAKSLRGDAMLDVIFNGSGSRKPAGMAEVVLVFDNPTRPEGGRAVNLEADEVAVGRRLFRDGTSEYQLNNAATRLRDIRELFLDTGIGVDAYSVIEQGRVAAMPEANPEQRRLIFEEAAGISKFKARRKEAERKLEKVDANLLRVGDIVEETEKRLRSVKIQAGKARVYQEHSTRLSELRLSYSLHEYHTHASSLKELQSQNEDVRFRLDDVQGDLATAQNELAVKKESQEATAQTRQRLEYEHVQAQAQIQSAKQRQQYAQQQLAQMSEQAAGFEQDKSQVAAKLQDLTAALETENKTLAALTTELEEQRRLIENRQQSFGDAQLQLNAIAARIEQRKSDILDLMRQLATVSSRIGAIEIERKNLAAQQDRLSARRDEVDQELAGLQKTGEELAGKLNETLATIADQQRQLEEQRWASRSPRSASFWAGPRSIAPA